MLRSPLIYRLRRRLKSLLSPPPAPPDGWRPAGGPVLVIAPHPDDEIVGCGGTLRKHVLAGDPATVVYLTRGESSRGYPWLSGPERQRVRRDEARAGCQLLGVRDLVFLTGKDGSLTDPGMTGSVAEQLLTLLRDRRPRLSYVPHAADSHPDHRAAYRLTRGAIDQLAGEFPCDLIQYEVWSPLQADYAVDVTAHHRLKLRALRRHRLALDAFDYVPTITGLSRYRCGTLLQRAGYAEAFKRT